MMIRKRIRQMLCLTLVSVMAFGSAVSATDASEVTNTAETPGASETANVTETTDTAGVGDLPATEAETVETAENTGIIEAMSGTYIDVNEGDWYYEYVDYVHDRGYMTGLNETTFGPVELLSRAQFATILYRVAGTPAVSYTPAFGDVEDDQFYTSAVIWGSANGIITGYSNGLFGPGDNVTREQIALMMYRYAKYCGYDTEIMLNDLLSFPDKGAVSGFAHIAMQWAVGSSLVTGTDGNLNPLGTANRAECATIITRFCQRFMTANAIYSTGSGTGVRTVAVGNPILENGDPATVVEFATWSLTGDQDDLVWYQGVKNSGGLWSATVDSVNHAHGGEYVTHVYVDGKLFLGGISYSLTYVPPDNESGKDPATEIQKYVYVPYVYGGKSTTGWDCSGFVFWALNNVFEVQTPYYTSYQWEDNGTSVNKSNRSKWKAGDVIITSDGGHVALYLGDNKMMHAADESTGTVVVSVDSLSSWTTIVDVRRPSGL